MQEIIKKFKKIFFDLVKFFPLYFKKYSRIILFAGMILALLWGAGIFYRNAYKVIQNTYEVFVSVRKANTQLIDEAITYINEQNSVSNVPIIENPFVK